MHHTGGCWLACMLAPGLKGARQALTEHPEVKEGVQLREYQIYALIEGRHQPSTCCGALALLLHVCTNLTLLKPSVGTYGSLP